MSRNFLRRVEFVFPVEEPALRERIRQILLRQILLRQILLRQILLRQILLRRLADNTKAWRLETDGSYSLVVRANQEAKCDSQSEFMALAVGEAKPGKGKVGRIRPKPKKSKGKK